MYGCPDPGLVSQTGQRFGLRYTPVRARSHRYRSLRFVKDETLPRPLNNTVIASSRHNLQGGSRDQRQPHEVALRQAQRTSARRAESHTYGVLMRNVIKKVSTGTHRGAASD
jgi:hypothetical protein